MAGFRVRLSLLLWGGVGLTEAYQNREGGGLEKGPHDRGRNFH